MRILAVLGALLLGALALTSAAPEPVCATNGCGVLPVKPMIPAGCQDLCPQCQCDEKGEDCRWVWACCRHHVGPP